MDTEYLQTKPNYLPRWQKFHPAIDRDIPVNTREKFATSPDLPRELMGENEFLSDKWDQMLLSNLHGSILGALTTQSKTISTSYEWRRVSLIPTYTKPYVYGDTPEIQTMTEQWFRGTLEGTVVGIKMPRGYLEKGMLWYDKLWDMQVKMAFDTLERFAQYGVYCRILNNPEQLEEHLKFRGAPLNITVEQYLERYINPIVNVFRKRDGLVRLSKFKNYYMDTFYVERDNDESAKSWVYLMSPDVNDHLKLERDENLLFLYRGPPSTTQSPKMDLYTYSTTTVFKDAVHVIKNFPVETSILGVNILYRNKEFARYYRIQPWKMLDSDRRDGKLSDYDIFITNERDESIERVRYTDAMNNLNLDKTPGFFRLFQNGVDEDAPNWWNLLTRTFGSGSNDDTDEGGFRNKSFRKAIKKITKGFVKTPHDYFDHMIHASGLFVLQKKIDEAAIARNGGNREALTAARDNRAGALAAFLARSNILNDVQAMNIVRAAYEGTPMEPNAIRNIFTGIPLYSNNPKEFRNQINELFSLDIDPPFALLIFKRSVDMSSGTPYINKQCIDQRSTKLMAAASQEYPGANIHVAIHKMFGERLKDSRRVNMFRDTFIKENMYGGDNEFWIKKGHRSTKSKNVYKTGSLWVVPVSYNEVIGSRMKLINRTGFDPKHMEKSCKMVRLEGENENNFYYSTYRDVRKYYGWDHIRKTHNEKDYYFNVNLVKFDTNHWAGYTRYSWNGSEVKETGPFKNHHCFWKDVPVDIHITGKDIGMDIRG